MAQVHVNRNASYDNIIMLAEVRDDGKERKPSAKAKSKALQPPPLEIHPYSEVVAPHIPAPSRFTAKWGDVLPRETTENKKRLPRAVKIYYRRQRKDIRVLWEARKLSSLGSAEDLKHLGTVPDEIGEENKWKCGCSFIQLSVDTAARLTLSVNFLLFFVKIAAAIQSGSLAVLSSMIDSGLDLFSGAAIATSSYLIKRYDRYHYPIGRNRLEPVVIIITAAVMATAALQIVTTAIEDIAENSVDPRLNIFSGTIIVLTVILKATLYIICRNIRNPSVQTLAVDHRNDVASNLAALVFGGLGTFVYKLLDPIGAILLAFYIIINWVIAGYEQLKNLVGHTADRRFLWKLTWIAANHDRRIETVDTVRAYSFGVHYLVEVDIQLAPNMVLREAHDIGESLQRKLELLDEVERAFVHLDFETLHSPNEEHKLPA